MMAHNSNEPKEDGSLSLTIAPWKVIEKALSVNPDLAKVIVTTLAVFAGVAIVGVWFKDGLDTGFALEVAGIGAAVYIGLTILANLPGLLVHTIAWFVAGVFMAITTLAVVQIVSGGRALPAVSVWCLYNWFGQGCALAQERPEIPIEPASSGDNNQLPGTQVPSPLLADTWLSVNRSEPWTHKEAERLGEELENAGWDVQTSQFNNVAAAEGTLEVRYSSPEYREEAINLAAALQKIVRSDTTAPVRVFDLSATKWRDQNSPEHIEVWIGRK